MRRSGVRKSLGESAANVSETMRSKESQPIAARNAYDPETPDALVAFMGDGWIDRAPAGARHGNAAVYRAHRDALSHAYPGSYLIVPAGVEQIRENDTVFRFRPNSDFAYLVPPGEQGTVLVMEPRGAAHRSILFVPERNRGTAEFFTDRARGEIWVGRRRGVFRR
jgi:Xaa-Pro aminopeptidase